MQADRLSLIGASTGLFGADWAQGEVRKVLMATGALSVYEPLVITQGTMRMTAAKVTVRAASCTGSCGRMRGLIWVTRGTLP